MHRSPGTDAQHSADRAHDAAVPPAVALPALALAVAGLVDLLFERIVYRIGIHVPRDPSVMSAYHGATAIGDGAFRYVMVLAVFAAIAAGAWLIASRDLSRRVAGCALVALALLDTLTIADGSPELGLAVSVVYGCAVALMIGAALASSRGVALRMATCAAGVALLAGQYPLVVARLSDLSRTTLSGVPSALTLAEAAVIAVPLLLFAEARPWRERAGRRALAAGIVAMLLASAAYYRAAATMAILSLWGAGVTMAFPAPVYAVALGAAVAAAACFIATPRARPLAIALALLIVAGVQPTVTQYNLAALLGMAALVFTPMADPAASAAGAPAADVVVSPGRTLRRARSVRALAEEVR